MNTTQTPMPDVAVEARRVMDAMTARRSAAGCWAGWGSPRTTMARCRCRCPVSYADIDVVVETAHGRQAAAALRGLGYVPNARFNALHSARRMLFYDEGNHRQLDVFVGEFSMCHSLDLYRRLGVLPATLSVPTCC